MALRDIAGQEKARRILLGMLKRDRVPSAMLLHGDTGIGKRLAAINYAKAVNCSSPTDFDSCDKCASCRKIDAGMHPDVSITAPEKDEIKIDEIRRLEESLFLTPLEGAKKVAIVDNADSMNLNAANAFLKTLEEPPDDSLVILVSSNPDRLPGTIRSRCVSIRFCPLSRDAFVKAVSGYVDPAHVDHVRRLSMGRPGLALSGRLKEDIEWFSAVLGDMITGESKEAWADKEAMRAWLDMAFVFLRDMMVFNITGNESDLLYVQESRRFRRENDMGRILDIYKSLQKVRGLLDFNLNRSITWNYVSGLMRTATSTGNGL